MDSLHLLLAAYAGYWFQTHYHPLRFYAMRASGYHIVSRSAIWGFFLLLPCYVLALFISPEIGNWFKKVLDSHSLPIDATLQTTLTAAIDTPAHLSAALALLLGFIAPWFLNLFASETRAATKAAELRGDFVEVLLTKAWTQERDVAVTIKGGKTYIGVPTRSGLLAHEDSDFTLSLLASGYRKAETQELVITTDYEKIADDLPDEDSKEQDREQHPWLSLLSLVGRWWPNQVPLPGDWKRLLGKQPLRHAGPELREGQPAVPTPDDLEITIPIGEVVSIRMFNIGLYNERFATNGSGTG